MFGWGEMNSANTVCLSTWLSGGISDETGSGGVLMVGAIQLSIMLGAAFGGVLLDHISAIATLIGGTCLLVFASLTIGGGERLKPVASRRNRTHSELGGVVQESICE